MTPSEYLKACGADIANAYARMQHTPTGVITKATYSAFIGELLTQFDSMRQNVQTLPWLADGQPYRDSAELVADVRDNRRVWVYIGDDLPANHPMREQIGTDTVWTANTIFRAVHDYYGHALTGCSFGPVGEECAFRAHRLMFSRIAWFALACETRAQSCTFNYGPHKDVPRHRRPFPEQKAGILPSFVVFSE